MEYELRTIYKKQTTRIKGLKQDNERFSVYQMSQFFVRTRQSTWRQRRERGEEFAHQEDYFLDYACCGNKLFVDLNAIFFLADLGWRRRSSEKAVEVKTHGMLLETSGKQANVCIWKSGYGNVELATALNQGELKQRLLLKKRHYKTFVSNISSCPNAAHSSLKTYFLTVQNIY